MSVVANVFAPEIEICGTGESLTGSLNVAVIVTILPDLYGPGGEYVMAAVGLVVSIVRVYVFDAEFALPSTSVAFAESIFTTTLPSVEPRTTSKVYVVPVPAKLDTVGEPLFAVPDIVISPITKSETGSLKVAV